MATRKEMTLDQAFGIALKRCRAKRKLTQEELAHEANLSLTSVGRMEIGLQGVRLDTVMRLANALGMTGTALVGEFERVLRQSKTLD